METGFLKANSGNLPRVDSLMVADFFARNKDFCEAEFRNVKTSLSTRESYGDDAVGYVQLKRSMNLCTIKCRVCPEHKVRAKPYTVTVVIDEEKGDIINCQCQDCAASAGGCKHAVAFLMWLHRRSEEPSCTEVECYWKKSTLSKVGTNIKFLMATELVKDRDPSVLNRFLETATTENPNCELVRYMRNTKKELEDVSMYQLAIKYRADSSDKFLKKIATEFTDDILKNVEVKTRGQSKNNLWHELRFARVTASKAFEISKCKTSDGALVSLIMGGKVPDTPAMKRGRLLEEKVLEIVQCKLGRPIKKCGLFICKHHPMIAVSPDGICKDFLIEIKCPYSKDTMKNYIQNGQPTRKCLAQIQLQMYVCGINKSYFCVADSNFQNNKIVNMINVDFDETYVKSLLQSLLVFWKTNIYPLLFKMTEI